MPLTRKDALLVGEILSRAAAAEIMPRFQRVAGLQIREKTSAFDVVTDADEAAEEAITAALRQAFPSARIIGEEAAAKDPKLPDSIATADLAFIIDPIDGTKNFTAGLPLFGVMAAATIRGEVVLGAIHDPVCGDTALALRGEGAWLQGDTAAKADLRVAAAVPVSKMDAIAGTNFLPEPLRGTVGRNLPKLAMHSWLRCAAHEYRMAAAGHCHLLLYNKLMPWDHAAGWLLHREAGGYSAHFDGSAYLPSHTTGGLLCAPDQVSWEQARAALLD
ncbi:inositol monophosphatase family protein [Ferrovibrio xuzhouensis]|uniref:Inositol monophosphatase family protein n=1 Tax=Ferrovibrio xuzhouensis TaxID=1576914 RepID=A0ABV7VJE6_9PROT